MNNVHVHLHVADLDASRAFYERFLGAQPVKQKPGYAKFLPAFAPINLALSAGDRAAGTRSTTSDFQVESREVVRELLSRVKEAGLSVREELGTDCCFANQDKFWVAIRTPSMGGVSPQLRPRRGRACRVGAGHLRPRADDRQAPMKTYVFACVHNAGRSQMAAAWFNDSPTRRGPARSGGHPAGHPRPSRGARCHGRSESFVDGGPQKLTDELAREATMFITMGCGDACPGRPRPAAG